MWQLILMLLLLAGSAFFSGSETAFFNLTHKQKAVLKQSQYRLGHLTALLLEKPQRLLGCLLLGNMLVNILFFAVSSVLVFHIKDEFGVTTAGVTAFVSLFVLILFGEVFPKSLAYSNSRAFSLSTAPVLYFVTKMLWPIQSVFRILIVEPSIRLILGQRKLPKAMTTSEFKSLIEASRCRGLITSDENKLLTEVIEFGGLKVRHVMQPRVDMLACESRESVTKARSIMLSNNLTKLPIYIKDRDHIVGLVFLRQILLHPERSLDKLIQPVNFVPEQKTVESLLEYFRKSGTDTAIVVDEYGGVAGLVRLEYIAGELLGPVEFTSEAEPIEKIGPFKFRLSGNLALHDWAESFGIKIEETRLCTIGGLATALSGKVPKSGDVIYLKNLKLTVEKVRKNRIESLILSFEEIPSKKKNV